MTVCVRLHVWLLRRACAYGREHVNSFVERQKCKFGLHSSELFFICVLEGVQERQAAQSH